MQRHATIPNYFTRPKGHVNTHLRFPLESKNLFYRWGNTYEKWTTGGDGRRIGGKVEAHLRLVR